MIFVKSDKNLSRTFGEEDDLVFTVLYFQCKIFNFFIKLKFHKILNKLFNFLNNEQTFKAGKLKTTCQLKQNHGPEVSNVQPTLNLTR